MQSLHPDAYSYVNIGIGMPIFTWKWASGMPIFGDAHIHLTPARRNLRTVLWLLMSVFQLCVARWVARKVVCKLNDCILGRRSSMSQRRRAPVAKRVCRLTLLNCSLASCFAAGVYSNLQLLEVSFRIFFLNKPWYQLIYSYRFSFKSSVC